MNYYAMENEFAVQNEEIAHLEHLLQTTRLSQVLKLQVEKQIESACDSLYSRLACNDLKLDEDAPSPKLVVAKDQIENSLMKEYVEKVQRQKAKLQQKLIALNDNIRRFEHVVDHKSTNSEKVMRPSEPSEVQLKVLQLAKQFSEKTKEERKERHRKMVEERLRKERVRLQEQKEREAEENFKKEAKKIELTEKIKQIEKKKEERERRRLEEELRLKAISQMPKLHEKMADRHSREVSLQIEQKKKKIEEHKKLYAPLSHQQLFQHEEQFRKQVEEKRQQRRMAREEAERLIQEKNQEMKYLRSKVEREDKSEDSRENKLARSREYAREYAEEVRRCKIPPIDSNKRKEISERLAKEEEVTQAKLNMSIDLKVHKQIGKRYLRDLANAPHPIPRRTSMSVRNSVVQPAAKEQRYHNYLKHSKRNSEYGNWSHLSKIEDPSQRLARIWRESVRQEARLKLAEQKAQALGRRGLAEEVDQQYVAMLEAKMAALSQM